MDISPIRVVRAQCCAESRNCDGAPETGVTSCSSVAKAVSTAMSTWGAAPTRQAARAARSNIQAGISSHRPDARPERLQRKTSLPAFSTQPHEYGPGIRPKDATDKEARTLRSRGRSVVVLYN